MADRVPCVSCNTMILAITAKMNDGMCHPCLKGSFNCEMCGKKVLITEGVNDNDKICLGCFQKNPNASEEGLVTVTESKYKQDIVVIYFSNRIKHRDKINEYSESLKKAVKGKAKLINIEEKKFYDQFVFSNFKDMEAIIEILTATSKEVLADEDYSVQGVRLGLNEEKDHKYIYITAAFLLGIFVYWFIK